MSKKGTPAGNVLFRAFHTTGIKAAAGG